MNKKPAPKGAEEAAEPNLKFVGKDREVNGKTIPAEALRRINHGEESIMLPGEGANADTEGQRAGFYHPAAALIVRLYPELYKLMVRKGEQS